MSLVLPLISREYLYVPGLVAFGDDVDVTTLPVEFAFTLNRETPLDDTDWHAGSWQPGVDEPTPRVLVHGPAAPVGAGLELDAGRYSVWLRVYGATEQPSRPIGTLVVK